MSSPAPEPQAEQLAQDLARELPSPYCPGRTISSCPSEAARELEDDILTLAMQGKDRTEIEAILVQRFGEDTMGETRNDAVFIAIIGSALVALIVIVVFARRWLRPTSAAGASVDVAGAGLAGAAALPLAGVKREELDRLEDELDELD